MYLTDPAPRGWHARLLQPRQKSNSENSQDSGPSSLTIAISVLAVAVPLLVVIAAWFFVSRRRRQEAARKGQQPVKQKRGFFDTLLGRRQYEQTPGDDDEQGTSHQLNSTTTTQRNRTSGNTDSNRGSAATSNVDRNTSIRSVLTLPAYRSTANHNEQVLGREGERDGIDTIIDLPTAEEDEERRDEEMETMYQIRVQRRRMISEREERRAERRDARLQNDQAALRDIRARTRAANEDTTIEDLRRTVDQIKDSRQRSVSTVSYMDIGIAQHDGTRIRANSTESERVGLLSDAASIGLSHHRGRSASSIMSNDGDFASLNTTRSRGNSTSTALHPMTTNGDSIRSGTSPEPPETDLGTSAMPPPEYEDVSLDEAGRSTTPLYEPPPDYPGPYRSASQRSGRLLTDRQQSNGSPPGPVDNVRSSDSWQGGVPRLPSLRVSHLPAIVIEPSSAYPGDGDTTMPTLPDTAAARGTRS